MRKDSALYRMIQSVNKGPGPRFGSRWVEDYPHINALAPDITEETGAQFLAVGGSLVLINQSEPNERSLDPQQGHTVVGGGDHLLKGLRRCFEQAIQFRIVTLSTSVR